MKLTIICDHKLIKKNNDFYIGTGTYERSVKRYLNVFNSIDYLCRSINNDDIQGMVHISDERVRIIPNNSFVVNVGFIFNYKKNVETIRGVIKNSECCIIHMPTIMGSVATKECERLGKRYMIELGGCPWDAYWNHSLNGKLVAPFLTLRTKLIVKNAPYVLYVTKQFLQRRYPTNGKAIGCSNVALTEFDENILSKRMDKINAMSNRPIILGTAAGINVRYKGQQYVIKAISRLNKQGYCFEYHLAGEGDNSYLKSVAEKFGVTDKVIFLGSLPHAQVFEYLGTIDIYAQPSRQEGLPRALIEAMSRGVPSIGSTTAGIPELLEEEFIFNNGNIDQICAILKRMNKNTMLTQAKRNFEKSKEYAKNILDARRIRFFEDFRDNN